MRCLAIIVGRNTFYISPENVAYLRKCENDNNTTWHLKIIGEDAEIVLSDYVGEDVLDFMYPNRDIEHAPGQKF